MKNFLFNVSNISTCLKLLFSICKHYHDLVTSANKSLPARSSLYCFFSTLMIDSLKNYTIDCLIISDALLIVSLATGGNLPCYF